MEWLRNLSDNEMALLGCCGALLASFGLVGGSYHLGRILRHSRAESDLVTSAASPSVNEQPASTRRAA